MWLCEVCLLLERGKHLRGAVLLQESLVFSLPLVSIGSLAATNLFWDEEYVSDMGVSKPHEGHVPFHISVLTQGLHCGNHI